MKKYSVLYGTVLAIIALALSSCASVDDESVSGTEDMNLQMQDSSQSILVHDDGDFVDGTEVHADGVWDDSEYPQSVLSSNVDDLSSDGVAGNSADVPEQVVNLDEDARHELLIKAMSSSEVVSEDDFETLYAPVISLNVVEEPVSVLPAVEEIPSEEEIMSDERVHASPVQPIEEQSVVVQEDVVVSEDMVEDESLDNNSSSTGMSDEDLILFSSIEPEQNNDLPTMVTFVRSAMADSSASGVFYCFAFLLSVPLVVTLIKSIAMKRK